MSVILEFSLPATEFQLGEALSGTPMQLEIERIVPTGDMIMPFVWATGDDHDSFAEGTIAMSESSSLSIELVRVDYTVSSGTGPAGLARWDCYGGG